MGLGLNTDKIVAGNIGSQRMDYTMIGDGVNLTRLESACKQYSARIQSVTIHSKN